MIDKSSQSPRPRRRYLQFSLRTLLVAMAVLSVLFGMLGRWLLAPEPHIGFHANSEGDTSQVYAGFTWLFDVGWNVFAGGSLGLAVHDGKESTTSLDRKELGLRVLFRESAEIGVHLTDRHALSVILDHISNAGIDENNEGLDTVGIRYTFQM